MLMLTLFQKAKLGVMPKTLYFTVLHEGAQDHDGYYMFLCMSINVVHTPSPFHSLSTSAHLLPPFFDIE